MSTALFVARSCAQRLQLPSPSALVGGVDNNMILLKELLEQTVQEIRNSFPWPELQKEYTFTLATSTANYVLPSDFDSIQMETLWNRDQKWPLIGPLDAVAWQFYKSGIVATFPMQRFRIKGWQTNQFYIDPTPDSGINGQTMAYEYISRTCIRPKTWAATTVWTGNQYCSYNGNIYDRGGVGVATTGTIAPTWTSGIQSDGAISWAYSNASYEVINNDTDEFILDSEMITDGAVWRFLQARGLDFEDYRARAEEQIDLAKSRLMGGSVLNVARMQMNAPMIGLWSYPLENF